MRSVRFGNVLLALGLVACGQQTAQAEYPYGTWLSDSGYYIIVDRNDTYAVCKDEECNAGSLVWNSPREDGQNAGPPYLHDFASKPLGMDILQKSGFYDRHIEDNPDSVNHPSLSPNVGEGSFRRRYCHGSPNCRHFGGEEKPEFSFYLK